MKRFLLLILTLFAGSIIFLFLLVLLPEKAPRVQEVGSVPERLEEPKVEFIDPIRGGENARVTIVEFGDFTCSLCKSIEPDLQELIAVAPRQRRLVWKDAPNAGLHPESVQIAIAARCAQDQGAFWDYHDLLMESPVKPNAQELQNLAAQLGLDPEAFDLCLATEVPRPIIEHNLDEVNALGVSGTPTLFINGQEYTGALTFEALNAYIEAL